MKAKGPRYRLWVVAMVFGGPLVQKTASPRYAQLELVG